MNEYKRQSIRVKGYDYSQPGYFFVTICSKNQENIFGEIVESTIILNNCGQMVNKWWQKLFEKYATITIDEYIFMPNHMHGIIHINNINDVGAIPCNRPIINLRLLSHKNIDNGFKGENTVSPLQRDLSIGQYVSWFKRMSTNEYIRNVKKLNWKPFQKTLWQRNYYDRIIRGREDLFYCLLWTWLLGYNSFLK